VGRTLAWLAVVGLIVLAGYRLKFRPLPVTAHRVTVGEVRGEVMGTGTLEARVKTTISPRIQERLAEVLVDQGDVVKTGQRLARLDDGEARQQVAIAEATLAAAQATVERVRADEARAQAVLKQAQQEHQRSSELLAGRISSQADFDKASEALQVSEADLVRARSANREAQSQVFTAEKSLLFRREQLTFTEMLSPYDGLITRRDRDPGSVVVPGSSILQLVAHDIWVSAWVDETAIATLKEGQPARVVFRSEPSKTYEGEVARLGREADRETREFVVDVRVKQLPERWTLGQRAEVFVETGRTSGVVVVPQSFVLWREGKPGLMIDDAGKARWRDVVPGLRGPNSLEIIQGLSEGDVVVKPPAGQKQPLNEGQRIRAR
jgi:HlyD family secretion protein